MLDHGSSPEPALRTKVTRQDWLSAARTALIDKGVDHVRILTLAEKLGVARSSFYWYFKDRGDLLDKLVESWRQSNTADIVEHAARPSPTIVHGVLNIFECWTDHARFDPRLDFAIREWSRRDHSLHALVQKEDEARVDSIAALYERHGYAPEEAFIRARVLYFMQIGYYALELNETLEQRLRNTAEYIYSFTGVQPAPEDIERFRNFARSGGRLPRP